MDQIRPVHRNAKLWVRRCESMNEPTAMHAKVELHETLASQDSRAAAGTGTGRADHLERDVAPAAAGRMPDSSDASTIIPSDRTRIAAASL